MKNQLTILLITSYNEMCLMMKSFSGHSLLKTLLLLIAVFVLLLEAGWYYGIQALGNRYSSALPLPTPTVSPVAPSPSPLPSLTTQQSQPSFDTQLVSFTLLKTIDQPQIEAAQTSFVGGPLPSVTSEIAIYQLKYHIKGRDKSWKPIQAKVYVPVTGTNYPLYVFGSGTTGMADKCAPSLENVAIENLGNYENHMISQASQGYVAVFPDYEGFNSSTATQAYFISESEAKTLIGAVKNLLTLQPDTPALQVADLESVYLGGYSQGGHAALSAAQAWNKLPTQVQLKGVLQFAGAADIKALFRESPWLAPYLVDSYSHYYASLLKPGDILAERWLQEMTKNNETLCVNQAYRYYPRTPIAVYTPAFLDALESQTWPTTLQHWQEAMDLNTPLTNLPSVPYLSIQGETDPIVTAVTQQKNTSILCQQGKQVLYHEYPGVNHFQIRQAGFTLANTWLKNIQEGKIAPSNCK